MPGERSVDLYRRAYWCSNSTRMSDRLRAVANQPESMSLSTAAFGPDGRPLALLLDDPLLGLDDFGEEPLSTAGGFSVLDGRFAFRRRRDPEPPRDPPEL